MTQINILVSRHSAFYSPLIYTLAGGFLKKEGLDPVYSVATAQNPVREGIIKRMVHVAQSAVSTSWGPMEKGEDPGYVHFAQINERDGFFVAGRKLEADFTWGRLAGRKVLVDHFSQPLAMFRYALHKMGVDYGKVRAIDAGDVDAIDRAFRAGEADYVHQQGPAAQQLEKDGVGYVVAAVGDAIGPVAFSSLCAGREWLESKAARAFMRAYRASRHYVIQAPAAEIAAKEADFFPGIDRDVLTRTIAAYQWLGCWTPDPRITREAYDVALDVFLDNGVITKRHAYENVVVSPPDEDDRRREI